MPAKKRGTDDDDEAEETETDEETPADKPAKGGVAAAAPDPAAPAAARGTSPAAKALGVAIGYGLAVLAKRYALELLAPLAPAPAPALPSMAEPEIPAAPKHLDGCRCGECSGVLAALEHVGVTDANWLRVTVPPRAVN